MKSLRAEYGQSMEQMMSGMLTKESNKLQQLLELEAEKLALEYKQASIEGKGTPQEVADRREGDFVAFLQKYFPFPYRIVKGNIIDSYGNSSQSIDCIVLNPSHPYTVDPQNDKASVIFADGVDFAIEIKPDLANESEIHRALKQIQSVKKLRRVRDGLLFQNKYTEKQKEVAKTIPGFIVADKTYKEIKLLVEKIVDYYIENHVPQIEQFDYIFVNNRAVIMNSRPEWFSYDPNANGKNNHKRVIAFWEGGKKSLAWFLFEMNKMPRSEPQMSDNVMSIYLKDTIPEMLQTFDYLNNKLIEAGV